MLKDFGSDTLPVDGSRTYDTSQNKALSRSTWAHINAAAAKLTLKCSKHPGPIGEYFRNPTYPFRAALRAIGRVLRAIRSRDTSYSSTATRVWKY